MKHDIANLQKPIVGKLFCIFSPKGGGGATSLAINLAHEIYKLLQDRVVLFDTEQIYNNVAMRLNVHPLHGLKALGQHDLNEVDDGLLSQVITPLRYGFDLLPSCLSIQDEQEPVSETLMGKTLDYLLGNYQYVIADLPSGLLDPHHQALIQRSEAILLTTQLDIPSVYKARQYINLLKENDLSHKVRLIINRADLSGAHGLSNLDLEKNLGLKVQARLCDDWELNLRANSLSLPLSEVNPDASLINEIVRLAVNLTDLGLDNLNAPAEANEPKFEFSNFNESIMKLLRKGLSIGNAHI